MSRTRDTYFELRRSSDDGEEWASKYLHAVHVAEYGFRVEERLPPGARITRFELSENGHWRLNYEVP